MVSTLKPFTMLEKFIDSDPELYEAMTEITNVLQNIQQRLAWGENSPVDQVTAVPGSLYVALDSRGGFLGLWIKTSGIDKTGWTQITIP